MRTCLTLEGDGVIKITKLMKYLMLKIVIFDFETIEDVYGKEGC